MYTTTADSGNIVKHHSCDDCGSLLYADGPVKIIKVGCLDDTDKAFADAMPSVGVYCKGRVSWVGEFAGTQRMDDMS